MARAGRGTGPAARGAGAKRRRPATGRPWERKAARRARRLVALEGAIERGEAGEQAAASGTGRRALRFQIAMPVGIGVPETRRPLTQF